MTTDILHERSDLFDTLSDGLPYGFVASMAEYGEEAMRLWLKKNAPDDVANLFENILCLHIEAEYRIRGRSEANHPDSSLLQYIAQVARTANDLGVTWRGADGGEFLMRGAGEPPFADDDEEETDTASEPVAEMES